MVREIIGSLLIALSVRASLRAEPAGRPEIECRFATGPILLDGVADEEAWKHAQTVENFRLPWLPGQPAARAATRARLLWDRDYIYFSAEMEDADLFADILEHNGRLWENDVLELLLKPAEDKPGYYEFHVTPAGTVLDAFFPRRGETPGTFNPGNRDDEFHLEARVRRNGTLNQRNDVDRGWAVEGRIPWYDFLRTGGRPDVNEAWKFAFCRYDYQNGAPGPERSTSAPLTQPSFHRHEEFETLRFVGPAIENVGTTSLRSSRNPLVKLGSEWRSVPSRVIGSPEPPLGYRVERVLPALKPSFPITVVNEPGSRRLLFLEEDKPYGPARLSRTTDDPANGKFETLLELGDLYLSIAFHPKYQENGYVYIGGSRVNRYTFSRTAPYKPDPRSKLPIIEWATGGHTGGAMVFGPDGMMYVTSGDGSNDSDGDLAGQQLGTLRSKVLRIDVDRPDPGRAYSIPADNPFVGVPGARPETWAYGLRNPWRMWLDRESGQFWIANNGQDLWEQIYLVERGANYGWSVYEGGHAFNLKRQPGPTPFSKPLFDHPHSEARSITGGLVYRGRRFPELYGASIYGDYATGRIWAAKMEGQRVVWHKELTSSSLAITALAADPDGELLIADHKGNGEGGFYTLVANDRADHSAGFPRRLSATGLFAAVAGHRLAPGMIPYSVNSPLWSDGAYKERALYLPATAGSGLTSAPMEKTDQADSGREPARIDVVDGKGWNFPDRTVLVKSFALELEPGNPGSRRWIETRLFTRQEGKWIGYSYAWNEEQTEATLVASEGLDREFPLKTSSGPARQKWRYPSRAECMVCHSRAANFVLGLSTAQMNREHDYGGVRANQLAVLEALGVVRVDAETLVSEEQSNRHAALVAAGLPASAAERLGRSLNTAPDQRPARASHLLARTPERLVRLVDPLDAKQPLETRARSYLQANCAHCHVYAGGGNSEINLLATVPRDQMKLVDEKPLHDTFGLENARLVAPGHPERSVLLHRISTRGAGQMPQLATSVVDREAVNLLREWISGIAPPTDNPTSK